MIIPSFLCHDRGNLSMCDVSFICEMQILCLLSGFSASALYYRMHMYRQRAVDRCIMMLHINHRQLNHLQMIMRQNLSMIFKLNLKQAVYVHFLYFLSCVY